MAITGTITDAGQASAPSGQHQVRYQDIVITEPTGKKWYGRIGSKQGYQAGTAISVTVEIKEGESGPYNYFRKYNPQYQGQQSAPREAPQGASHPQTGPNVPNTQNNTDMVRIRSMALSYAKDLLVVKEMQRHQMWNMVLDFTAYIMTGRTPKPVGGEPNPDYSDNPPLSEDDDPIPF